MDVAQYEYAVPDEAVVGSAIFEAVAIIALPIAVFACRLAQAAWRRVCAR